MADVITCDEIVLGFGLSGLAASVYKPDATVVAKPNLARKYDLGPLYLYDTEDNRDLCRRLKIPVFDYEVKVGWMKDGLLEKPSKSLLREYYKHVRGKKRPSKQWMKLHMKETYRVLDAGHDRLSLYYRDLGRDLGKQFYADEITSIDLDNHLLHGVHTYKYDKLTSTIPWPTFARLASLRCRATWTPIYCECLKFPAAAQKLGFDIKLSGYTYVYIVDAKDKSPYRATDNQGELTVDLEYLKPVDYSYEIYFGKIVSGATPRMHKHDVKFLGRYAQWQQSMKTHDVVAQLRKEEEAYAAI